MPLGLAVALALGLCPCAAVGIGAVRAQERKSRTETSTRAAAQTHGHAPRLGTVSLWFFFSHTGADLTAELRALGEFLKRHREVEPRPCLLVDDWEAVEHPSEEFGNTLKELRSLMALVEPGPLGLCPFAVRIWDEEGLAFARDLGIERVPAFALVTAGESKVHVAYGQGARLEKLWTCK